MSFSDEEGCFTSDGASVYQDTLNNPALSEKSYHADQSNKMAAPSEKSEKFILDDSRRFKLKCFSRVGPLGPPPDGGTAAWLQVLTGHCACITTWGLLGSFGVFQSHYAKDFSLAPSPISWIGTVQIFLLFALGAISGKVRDAGFAQEAILLGNSMIVLGLVLASFATRYYQVILSLGVCVGLGMGLVLIPVMSVTSTWFGARKNLAVAIIASGAGTGGLIYPVIYQQLFPAVGLGWTLRVMALVTAIFSIIITMTIRVRLPAEDHGPLMDLAALKELPYVLYIVGYFLIYWATYFGFYYIVSYGEAFASFSETDSINILLVTNAIGVPGRILPGYIASRFIGGLNTAVICAALVALVTYLWAVVGDSKSGIFVFACFYGLFASALLSLFAITLTAITDDLKKLGTRMGMVFSIVAVAVLTGSPLAGALVRPDNSGYLGAQVWAGTALALGALALGSVRVLRVGWTFKARI